MVLYSTSRCFAYLTALARGGGFFQTGQAFVFFHISEYAFTDTTKDYGIKNKKNVGTVITVIRFAPAKVVRKSEPLLNRGGTTALD